MTGLRSQAIRRRRYAVFVVGTDEDCHGLSQHARTPFSHSAIAITNGRKLCEESLKERAILRIWLTPLPQFPSVQLLVLFAAAGRPVYLREVPLGLLVFSFSSAAPTDGGCLRATWHNLRLFPGNLLDMTGLGTYTKPLQNKLAGKPFSPSSTTQFATDSNTPKRPELFLIPTRARRHLAEGSQERFRTLFSFLFCRSALCSGSVCTLRASSPGARVLSHALRATIGGRRTNPTASGDCK